MAELTETDIATSLILRRDLHRPIDVSYV